MVISRMALGSWKGKREREKGKIVLELSPDLLSIYNVFYLPLQDKLLFDLKTASAVLSDTQRDCQGKHFVLQTAITRAWEYRLTCKCFLTLFFFTNKPWSYKKWDLLCPPPPPPSVFYDPQLKIMRFYIARYRVEIMHVHLGGHKTYIPSKLGEGGGVRIDSRNESNAKQNSSRISCFYFQTNRFQSKLFSKRERVLLLCNDMIFGLAAKPRRQYSSNRKASSTW